MSHETWYNITPKDILGNSVDIKILRDVPSLPPGFTPYEFTGGANIVSVRNTVQKQDIYESMRLIDHEIRLMETDSQNFNSIRDSQSQTEWMIKTEVNNNEVLTFVDNSDYTEPFKSNPKEVIFSGFEGFHILKRKEVTDYDGNAFEDYVTVKNVLVSCMKKLGISGQKVNLACNLFETNHSGSADPLDQTYIEAESLYENNELINCQEAVKRLMDTFGLAFFMAEDAIWFIRIAELYKTSITYYQYTVGSGGFVKTDTFNPRITLTVNPQTRTARKDWINANTTLSIIPGYHKINVRFIGNIKETFWKYSFFEDFNIRRSQEVPDQWALAGFATTRKVEDENYTLNGKVYYPVKILGKLRYPDARYVPGIWAVDIPLKFEIRSPYFIRIRITVTYRVDWYNQNTSDANGNISQQIRISNGNGNYEYDPDTNALVQVLSGQHYFKTLENVSATDSGNYRTDVTEFNLSGDLTLPQTIGWYKITGLWKDGRVSVSPDLIIKNIKFEALYYNADLNEVTEVPDSIDINEINSDNFSNDYDKELYYGDRYFLGDQGEALAKKLMYRNLLYYKSGSDYKLTSEWDYDSKGLDLTIQEVMLYDLQYQYGTPCHVLNGDLMGYDFRNYNVFVDTKDGSRLFLPLTTSHSLKYAVLSGEFMELKSSEIGADDYLADEADDAILDESGNEILVNF